MAPVSTLPSMESTLLQLPLLMAGHVARMEDSRMPKRVPFQWVETCQARPRSSRKKDRDQLKNNTDKQEEAPGRDS